MTGSEPGDFTEVALCFATKLGFTHEFLIKASAEPAKKLDWDSLCKVLDASTCSNWKVFKPLKSYMSDSHEWDNSQGDSAPDVGGGVTIVDDAAWYSVPEDPPSHVFEREGWRLTIHRGFLKLDYVPDPARSYGGRLTLCRSQCKELNPDATISIDEWAVSWWWQLRFTWEHDHVETDLTKAEGKSLSSFLTKLAWLQGIDVLSLNLSWDATRANRLKIEALAKVNDSEVSLIGSWDVFQHKTPELFGKIGLPWSGEADLSSSRDLTHSYVQEFMGNVYQICQLKKLYDKLTQEGFDCDFSKADVREIAKDTRVHLTLRERGSGLLCGTVEACRFDKFSPDGGLTADLTLELLTGAGRPICPCITWEDDDYALHAIIDAFKA